MMLATTNKVFAKVFIYHGAAMEGQQVWFHNVFSVKEIPDSAMLSMSSSGYLLAYVNGRVVGTQSIWPYRPVMDKVSGQKRQGIATQSIDIRRLLRTGKNVISIWYAPCIDARMASLSEDSTLVAATSFPLYQLSPELNLWKGNKKETLCTTENNWLCRISNVVTTLYGEDCDATAFTDEWKKISIDVTPEWVRPEKAWREPVKWDTIEGIGEYACNTITAVPNEITDSTQAFYFPTGMTGQIRITLRGTKKGQILDVNGMKYVCLGVSDEQFFTRFTTLTAEEVMITNDMSDPQPKVQSVEMILLNQRD